MNNRNNNQNYYYGNQNGRQNGQYYNNRNGNYPNQNMNYNNQYYNQNQNQQNKFIDPNLLNNNKDKKKKINIDKKLIKKIGIGIGIIVILILGFFAIKSCSKNSNDVTVGENEKRVGNSSYGFITIPKEWVNLKDENSSSGLKYSDIDVTYAVTLDFSDSLSAHDFANTAKSQLENAGVTNMEITNTTLNNYDAYKLTGYHEGNQIWILVYFFEGTDDMAHYVGIEGPDNNSEYFKIPESFRIDK